MDKLTIARLITQLHRICCWCEFVRDEGAISPETPQKMRALLHEATERVQGNRQDKQCPDWPDVRLIVAGVLRKCLEMVDDPTGPD